MSQQISIHFESIIGLQMNQLKTLADTIPSSEIHTSRTLQENLIAQAQARDFTYLGFCASDGSLEMLYGSQLTVTDPQPFLDSLNKEQQKVAIGTNASGEKVILLGAPSPWPTPLSSGETAPLSSAPTTLTATITLSGFTRFMKASTG